MKRKLNQDDVPEAVKDVSSKKNDSTFAALRLDPRLLQAITHEKLSTPTPVQSKGIPLALTGKDILARAKTGSGKTLAYLLPILHNILRRNAGAGKSAKQTTALILVPSTELATQVMGELKKYTDFCGQSVRYENVSKKEDAAVTKASLAEKPDLIVGTPTKVMAWVNQDVVKLEGVQQLVIDEADLVLEYEHEEALQAIATALPSGVQKIFMSATLKTEVDTVTSLFFPTEDANPTILDFSAEEAEEKPTLTQYIVPVAEQDKFLLIYAIFKLQLIKGKVIIFVADVDRCYRVKLFLEQFGIRSCVLNSELPINSRFHAVEEFNKGVYDIIIAADEAEVVGESKSTARRKRRKVAAEKEQEKEDEEVVEEVEQEAVVDDAEDDDAEPEEATPSSTKPSKKNDRKPRRQPQADPESSLSRGIDFRHVSCVLNFDLPTTSKSYTHRIGRTARAGQTGMSLSFYIPKEQYRKHKSTSIEQCEKDEDVLDSIQAEQEKKGARLEEWAFDMAKLEGFRYRFNDALRGVTRIAVREARTKELKNAIVNSAKLSRYFEENPEDLRHLRHDTESHAVRQQMHLRHVPDYLLPAGGQVGVKKDVGWVGLRKEKENGLRKRRAFNKGRGKGRLGKGKGLDALKSLNARGRGKK
ncbi:ATP-dependent DNA/RNA helicase [Recurvomyces mirabilis]|uniref:RNA helicase n=1 Tax=Recurvomyces mirabilis TaxID=574656 RepID=A0AAE1C430_9PEZI|nr:ATP-dependent DNA/RNA helicase [Recurvomyces mirabilis]KAK5156874.1 ATP-dependent DNA/RNA helicase [Recurvomyces mirabilis]